MMVNLRPYRYSWKRSTPKTIERESLFQFGHLVSRNHAKRETNILLDAIVGFLTSHGFVRGVLLLLQNLHLFLILLVSLKKKIRMGADVIKIFNFSIVSNWGFCKLKATSFSKSARRGAVTSARFGMKLPR